MMLEKGLFIVFEGIDGSGTSTQVNRLQTNISNAFEDQDVLITHEPWRPSTIKRHLENDDDAYSFGTDMAQLYVLDREDHLNNSINLNVKQGAIVLCARYRLSTHAFQGAQGVSYEEIEELHRQINAPYPDLTFFLDVDYENARKRIERREKPLEKFEKNPEFVKKVIENYRDLFKRGGGFGSTIGANQSEEKVAEDVWDSFMKFYNTRS